MRDIDNTILIP